MDSMLKVQLVTVKNVMNLVLCVMDLFHRIVLLVKLIIITSMMVVILVITNV